MLIVNYKLYRARQLWYMVTRLHFLALQITVTVLHSITVFAAMSSSCFYSNGPLVFLPYVIGDAVVFDPPHNSATPLSLSLEMLSAEEDRYHANTRVLCVRTENLCSEVLYLLSVSAICCQKHKSHRMCPCSEHFLGV